MSSPNYNFWRNLRKPFFIMAPMADVTDAAFRQIIAKYSRHGEKGGGPDVFYTEFVAADGLVHPEGRKRLIYDLKYSENERPIVAQLFSGRPEKMREAGKMVRDLGFDGLDINMGCPDKTIEKQGAGAALTKNPKLAQELIAAAKEGFGGPVAVKTRLGYSRVEEMGPWLDALIEAKPVVITLHLRTRKEMSKVPAHWELAKEAARQVKSAGILFAANGDVTSIVDAKEKAEKNDLDGVMLGRAIFGNPWLFAGKSREEIPTEERLRVLVEHTYLFEEYLGEVKSFAVMKKFFKAYIAGHPEAKTLQEKLMLCTNAEDVEQVINSFVRVDK